MLSSTMLSTAYRSTILSTFRLHVTILSLLYYYIIIGRGITTFEIRSLFPTGLSLHSSSSASQLELSISGPPEHAYDSIRCVMVSISLAIFGIQFPGESCSGSRSASCCRHEALLKPTWGRRTGDFSAHSITALHMFTCFDDIYEDTILFSTTRI